LMVRTIDRRRELAVRTALGATPSDIARQLLLEAIAIGAIGAGAVVLVAAWLTPAAAQLVSDQFGAVANRDIVLSWRVVIVSATVALMCASICGAVPALAASRWTSADVLRRGATASARELTTRRLFVVGEVAIAFVLLVAMTLLGRALLTIFSVDPGFDPRGVLTLHLALPSSSYDAPQKVATFYSRLERSLQDKLGSGSAAIIDEIPLTGDRGRVQARRDDRADIAQETVVRSVGDSYFSVMRIPVLAGQSFGDPVGRAHSVIVSESFSRKLFGGEPPVGRQIRVGSDSQLAEVVGVVGDVKLRALDEPPLPTLYESAAQSPSPGSIVLVRSERSDADIMTAVREAVGRLDPNLPVYGVRRMEEIVGASPGVPTRRLLTATFAAFALLAVVLSAIGLFGIAAHDVAMRRKELALRIALGADPMRLLRATLAQGVGVVAVGLVLGGILSVWAASALRSVVPTSAGSNIVSATAAAVVLMAAACSAVFPAALRAARTDPLLALRSE